ncbi:hypothetical protein M3M35_01915 [Fructilactobacillus myrtifloralis]|uniref:Uncharacterized protein n=1 Tax=Fructilactobacillus myrtifloralis TaxID=2940301 RepID=A0ABY5BPF7_9LACO|nr:hypothetical protein [Fructilactobacillus myrtifloralis]USS85445.1 hypothetical protein M3M35_01915 [Fructilactobacillus myrtifloralis]
MDITEFNYYQNLKSRLTKVQAELKEEQKAYLKQMGNLKQLYNDYDVETTEQLANALNQGDDDQFTAEIATALDGHDQTFLLENVQTLNPSEAQQLAAISSEANDVETELTRVEKFYQEFALPLLDRLKTNRMLHVEQLTTSGSDCDTVVEINYFSTFDDFKEDFNGAAYVGEVIEQHLQDQKPISVIVTDQNYPNKYDVTLMPTDEESDDGR